MRIKKWLLIITILFVLVYAMTVYYITDTQMKQVDIVSMNDTVKTLEEEYQTKQMDMKRSGIEDRMRYRITFLGEEDYNAQINQAIREQDIVFDLTKSGQIVGKIILSGDRKALSSVKVGILLITSLTIGSIWLIVCVFTIFLDRKIVYPFRNMQTFARSVAQGDLEFKLPINKDNYFGAFTESFDLMREELKRARQGEYEANRSKKELVAELSHDILTPIATIKAVCELMEARWSTGSSSLISDGVRMQEAENLLDFSREKINVVYHKADMVDQLISNLFQTTLQELEMLKVEAIEVESQIIERMFQEINHYEQITFLSEIPKCLILCDPLRLSQVIDNIINNSYKYAGTRIDVKFTLDREEKLLKMKIKDYGAGVDESELPLICQKFYRGSKDTVKKSSGSGLGLYLVQLFIEQMQGTFTCYNEDGFAVEIGVRVA
ncbi:MAG TPA: HAMP domain-containing sensor histidine kinase [Lachnospiraceae bacterium]|nr:HAMP domain-containing sensor histidine kinase [Lachnospiraceae bacterium]